MLNEGKGKKKASHFTDKFMDKLLKHALATEGPEKEHIERRMNDPDRTNKPKLSLKTLASNFKRLSGHMSGFFTVQYGLIHIITWRKPTKTLSFLVFYTCICLWPHLILVLPVFYMLFGVLVPGYLQRHPMQTPEIIKVKKRGQTLFDFFNQSSDHSILEDFLDNDYDNEEPLRPSASRSSDISVSQYSHTTEDSNSTIDLEFEDMGEKSDKRRYVKSQMTLLLNMRDLQNLTTDVLKSLDAFDDFWYNIAGFKDEELSTIVFYGLLAAASGILLIGQLIPWRSIFIQSGWVGIILCHPKSKKYLLRLGKVKKAANQKKREDNEMKTKIVLDDKKVHRHEVIVDGSPEVRIAEVYEIQSRSALKSNWAFVCYGTKLFDLNDRSRMGGKRPKGADHLSKILPSPGWKFEVAYVNHWKIDYTPQKMLHERSLDDSSDIIVKEDESDGWIYDQPDSLRDKEADYEFRRRRLTRECYRFSRPLRDPRNVGK